MQSPWGALLALSFAGAFALLLLISVRASRRAAARRQNAAAPLGLRPLSAPDPALLQRISGLLHRAPGSIELRNAFQRTLPEGDLFLFDLWDTSGGSSSPVAETAFALRVAGAAYPRLSLLPRLEETNPAAGLANRFIGWVAARSLPRIEFDTPYEFAQHYLVFGEDEPAARAFLDENLRSRLSNLRGVGIELQGEMILVSDAFRRISHERPAELSSELDRALSVFRMFTHG